MALAGCRRRSEQALLTEEEFRALVQGADPRSFVRHGLLGPDCYVFDTETIKTRGTYAQFQGAIADHLDLNPRNVAVIGSAKFGRSMAPDKFGAPYQHGDSDIDIAIVSRELFESAWRQLRQAYFNGYEELRREHRNAVFARFIVLRQNTDKSSSYLRDLRIQMMELNRITSQFLSIEDMASYRIYSDWSDFELYHEKGLRQLQERLRDADA